MLEYDYIDVIIMGPRASGKTSIVELWTSPWTQIGKLEPSATWRVYQKNIYESAEFIRHNRDLELDQTIKPTLRLRVHDFPGEDSYRVKALAELRSDKKCVLMFVMKVGIVGDQVELYRDNALYFSASLADTLFSQAERATMSVSKAIIVFNKADLLPKTWSDDEALVRLRSANRDALYQIERLFSGKLEYHLTSAATNRGLIQVLGSIGRCAISTEADQARFDDHISKLEREFGLIKT
ncbi:MAG: GTPase domain-containing protein [Acidobacteria bacterium]|nr:GTPase domain-containing protein [Acidobacteriota bacterium]